MKPQDLEVGIDKLLVDGMQVDAVIEIMADELTYRIPTGSQFKDMVGTINSYFLVADNKTIMIGMNECGRRLFIAAAVDTIRSRLIKNRLCFDETGVATVAFTEAVFKRMAALDRYKALISVENCDKVGRIAYLSQTIDHLAHTIQRELIELKEARDELKMIG